MDKQHFLNEVNEPLMRFLARANENICVQPDFGDVISLAIKAAAVAYHFHEAACCERGFSSTQPMSDHRAEILRQKISDVVETSQHGTLQNPDRQTKFHSAVAFEFNEQDQFRYLRTEILAKNVRFGEIDIARTLIDFMGSLMAEHNVDASINIKIPGHPFKDRAEFFVTSEAGSKLNGLRVRMYKRDEGNGLVLANTNFELEILQAT